jgi:hypothetical protein
MEFFEQRMVCFSSDQMIDHIGCGGKLTRDKTEWSKHFRGEVYSIHILFWITSGLSGRARLPEDD